MSIKRTVYVFEFSPDDGKRWFPLCNGDGYRIWSSQERVPPGMSGWRTNVRHSESELSFKKIPDGFDAGVCGVQRVEDNQEKWLPDRTEVAVRFMSGANGFTTLVNVGKHGYLLYRHSSLGEPIWRMVGDVLDWYDKTLCLVEPRGAMARDVEVLVDGTSSLTGEFETAVLGNEFRLRDYLHGWMTKVGDKPWSETA